MANARFMSLGGGLTAELIAVSTTISYDPTSGTAKVNFVGMPFIKPGDVYLNVGLSQDVLEIDLGNKLAQCPVPAGKGFLDPVTGVDLGLISFAGITGIIKFVYDKYYNLRAAERLAMQGGLVDTSNSNNAIPPTLLPLDPGPSAAM